MSLFVLVTGILSAGTCGNKLKGKSVKQTQGNKIAIGVWTIYYLMIVITASVLLQAASYAAFNP